jgi:putative transposase
MKQHDEWLRSVNAGALTYALDSLCLEINRRLEKGRKSGEIGAPLPKLKSKKAVYQSYKVKGNKVSLTEDSRALIPSLGAVPCRVSRKIEGTITSATILRSATGYYVVINCADVETRALPKTGKSAAASPPIFAPKRERRLKRLKRALSRKTIGGQNWSKLNLRMAKERERLANRETDMYHKASTNLIRHNGVIRIGDCPPSMFTHQLEYKAKWYGRRIAA